MLFVRKRMSSFSTVPYVGQSDSSMSGNSRCIADGCIMPPDSRCDPVFLPFSIRATGTSPSDSARAESSSSSCISRTAQARPAGPPPTIATPTSMRSSSASSGGPTNSFSGCTGGGKSIGATDIFGSAALLRLHCLSQLGQDLVQVADDAQVGELEDRRVLVLVDRDDVLRRLHADLVLDGARDAGRQVQLRRDGLAGLADLRGVRVPARVDDRAGRRHRATQGLGQLLAELEALGLAQAAAARDEDLGVLDVHVGAALLAALLHRGLGRPVGEVDVDVLDLRVARAVLGDLERVQAADDHAGAALVGDVDDGGVLQDRALGHELAVLGLDVRDLHGPAAAQARGDRGARLEAEQAAAEQHVVVAVVLGHLGQGVGDRLRQALGALDAVDLRRAVLAERLDQVVGQVVAAEHERGSLAADLTGQLRGLRDGAEGVLVELALVVEDVGEDPTHASSFLSSSQETIRCTVSSVSSSSMISPACFSGGGLIASTWVREPSEPTRLVSISTSPVDFVSSCFFFAPMIALSDG